MLNSIITPSPPNEYKKESLSKLPLGLVDEMRVGKINAPGLLESYYCPFKA